jgi:hypothetical protein
VKNGKDMDISNQMMDTSKESHEVVVVMTEHHGCKLS